MGQDRVRPLALALQGLDYTVRGQTVGGGRERVCRGGGGGSRRGECVVAEEGMDGERGSWRAQWMRWKGGERRDRGVQPNLPAGGTGSEETGRAGWANTAVRLDWI